MANETASEHGCTAEVFIETGYPSVKNDERLTDFCKKTAAEYLCETDIKTVPQQMTAEDFGWYSQKIPACFYRLGTSNPDKAIDSMQHTSTFNIDENAMQLGTGLMAFIAIKLLENENIISSRN